MTIQDPPRYELKYVVSQSQAGALVDSLKGMLEPDPNSVAAGGYKVSSLYFDTNSLDAYFEKIDGVDPRHKIRLRSYGGGQENPLFLEVKRRLDSRVQKVRSAITWSTFNALELSPLTIEPMERGIDGTILRYVGERPLYPTCVVTYWRQAFLSRVRPGLRVTVDVNLRTSAPASFLSGQENDDKFLPEPLAVLEVKANHAIPLVIVDAVQSCGLTQRRYSKYCSALERLNPAATVRTVQRAQFGRRA